MTDFSGARLRARANGVVALLALANAACTRAPSATPPDERGSQRDRLVPSASVPAAAQPPQLSTPEPAPALDGCLTDLDLDAGVSNALEQASSQCLAGMQRLQTMELDAGIGIAFRLDDPSRCVRAAAAGTSGVRALEIAIVDASGRRLAAAQPRGPFGWIPAAGPLCVSAAGTYRVEARVTSGTGTLALGAWQAKAE